MKKLGFGLVALALVSIAVWLTSQAKLPLITPFWRSHPDLRDKLSQKKSLSASLDYSRSVQIESLSGRLKYLVYNFETGRVYAAREQAAAIAPASFTKLLTVQVALDVASSSALLKATDASVNKEPTVLGLKAGEQLTLTELLRASIATSANDAAATIGEGVAASYGQERDFFIDLMNQKAAILGMAKSHFTNPEGYDHPSQFSTLDDLAKLVNNSLSNYPLILAAAAGNREDITATMMHGQYYLPNWNGLLNVYPGVDGLKIAYTQAAGYSTIVTAVRGGVRVVAILVGADSILERDRAAGNLLDAAFIIEKQRPINLGKTALDRRYKEWADLAAKIKAELADLAATASTDKR